MIIVFSSVQLLNSNCVRNNFQEIEFILIKLYLSILLHKNPHTNKDMGLFLQLYQLM